MEQFKGDNLYAKIRYNINHMGTPLRWRLFVIENGVEQMFLCTQIHFYKQGTTYEEQIDGVGHYSIVIKADSITIDDEMVGWVQ